MNGGNLNQERNEHDVLTLEQTAALDNHLRLQQHQEEFLKWLESSESKQDIDQYVFKKIR